VTALRFIAGATLLVIGGAPQAAPPATGREVMERVNGRPRPPASVRRMELVLRREGGRRIEREIVAYQIDDGQRTKTVYSVVAPVELRGLAILRSEREGEETQWLQIEGMPAPVRAESIDPGVPFWGTEFTLGDVRERFWLGAYDLRLVREETWHGRPCMVVDANVRDERLGYRRITGWIDSERWLVLKAKYRDRHGRPLKLFWSADVRNVDGYWVPHLLAMRNVRTRLTTAFRMTAAGVVGSLPEELFTPAGLGSGRGRCFPVPCG